MFKFRAEWLQNGSIVARDDTKLADREAYLQELKNRANIMRDANPRHSPDSVRVFDSQGTALGTFRV